jgi:hypothetical protein
MIPIMAFGLTITKEFSFNTSPNNYGDFQSTVTTFNGCIYAVWIAPDSATKIAKKDRNGIVTTATVFKPTRMDNYHTTAAVGVSSDGYIFVAGNMHGHNWFMRRSTNPEDIRSFITPTVPQGTKITYPYFTNDRKGKLYITNRNVSCLMGGMISEYQPLTKTWKALGEIPSGGCVPYVLFQSDVKRYASYKTRLFFDPVNRMHVSSTIWTKYDNLDGNASNATHVLYAFSTNEGRTFRQAGGSYVPSLPVTIDNGTLVYNEDPGTIYNCNDVGATPDGTPLVSYKNKLGSHLMIRLNGIWKQIAQTNRFIVDNNGVITYSSGTRMYQSSNKGTTWTSFTAPRADIYDISYLAQTNNIRYSNMISNVFTVYTITNIAGASTDIENLGTASGSQVKFDLKKAGVSINIHNSGTHSISIFNAGGRLVHSFDGSGNSEYALNRNIISQGAYLVKVTVAGQSYTKQIVVQ